MGLTADEQLLIELINRARLDPIAAADSLDHGLNEGLAPGTITAEAKQALAPSDALMASARGHSKWMLQQDIFSHTGAGGTRASERMEAAGYEFSGAQSWSYENIALGGSTASLDRNTQIVERYVDLYESESHREATFAPEIREIGVAHEMGTYQKFNASMLTENFGRTGDDVFVTGVVYQDQDRDGFYSIGEGKKGYWIEVAGTQETTAVAGGYGVAAQAGKAVDVSLGKGNKTLATLQMDLSDGNGKLDLILDRAGRAHLELSASATLEDGISNAVLLGVADLDIVGQKGRNILTGNSGDNDLSGGRSRDKLYGGDGDDRIYGDQGQDKLFGGDGDDYLAGGSGNDRLKGGAGRDTFVFEGGRDKIRDFDANRDTVVLNIDGFGQKQARIDAVLDDAEVRQGDLVLDFGKSGTLTLINMADVGALGDMLDFA